jgi:uncharacterized protein (TIGR01777 family)
MPITLIAGGTGLIGKRLCEILAKAGHEVRLLSRSGNTAGPYPTFAWDPEKNVLDRQALEQVDYVINLSGAGIADKPWTPARKKLIIDSRVKGNLLLRQELAALPQPPKAFVSSAAVGYYGMVEGNAWVDESHAPGQGFLPESCVAWEGSIRAMTSTGIRTVGLRVGVVLAKTGGALPKLVQPFKFGVAPYFGNGQVWMPWIALDDVCRMFQFALENEHINGMYNAVAPYPARNIELVETALSVLGSKAIKVPTPPFALRLALGEMADVVLTGARVSAQKIADEGFEWEYRELEKALLGVLKQ